MKRANASTGGPAADVDCPGAGCGHGLRPESSADPHAQESAFLPLATLSSDGAIGTARTSSSR
ncbi:MAG TPA: hypothetical protein VEX67_16950, partial [Solirubrobacteraceae bacterium]|nr:hypothetical protein [Solirubrobacteraceae bacterium]